MQICAVIPTHNHHTVLADVVAAVRASDLAVIIVDDGSDHIARDSIARLHDPDNGVTVQRLDENCGKGIAVMTGFATAQRHGYTHALQVDADGQHDLARIPDMLRAARANPNAVITGKPVYDDSIPAGRKFGRWITHFWVWVETLSLHIRDSMCGFRIYPIDASLLVWQREGVGAKMDFDTEIMVRLYWRGVDVVHIPVEVIYPEGNISNFRMWDDNVLITLMHIRLVLGMIARLPGFVLQGGHWQPARPGQTHQMQAQSRTQTRTQPHFSLQSDTSPAQHWADIDERGMYWGMRFLGMVYKAGGRYLCLAAMLPVIVYFFLTGETARKASRKYLRKMARANGTPPPRWRDSFAHFWRFGEAALDKIAGWSGEMKMDDVILPDGHDGIFSYIPKDRAIVLLVSHFGNIEIIRALASRDRDFRVNVLLHQKNAARFGKVLKKLAPESQVNLIEVSEIGPDTAIMLSQKVEQGEWVVIAADRVAIGARDKTVMVPFLGDPAPLPQGPFILAHLLGCPVYMTAAWRTNGRFEIAWEKLTDRMVLPRGKRIEAITDYATQYMAWLEQHVRAHPLQWYNFFDFWARPRDKNDQQ
ncbi:glycosyltransferase family 2 protein [Thalassospira marina]|uniref:Acyltransferase n=1 Tax=Thalassospira marina TaxID=2048283 RepID=A0A2N3KRE9_9PROT|nr:glycosyltransferase family 2 protein [Thalassospira marina]PKR53127.1 acyltransferase [Thalassospira marina]